MQEVVEISTERVLTPEEVEQIRKEARTPGKTYLEVAQKWNLDRGHVAYIANREKGELP